MFRFIRKWWIRRKMRLEREDSITDEMREKGLMIRRLQAQIGALEKQVELKQRLNVLEGVLGGGEEKKNTVEEQIALAILQKFLTPQMAKEQAGITGQMQTGKQHLSDEQIETFIKQNNYLVKNIRDAELSDEEIEQEVRTKVPTLDDDTVQRAVKIFSREVKEGK